MLKELKRYIKFNSNKLAYLRLRNTFFDRLRNRGFKSFNLFKLFKKNLFTKKQLLFQTNLVPLSNVEDFQPRSHQPPHGHREAPRGRGSGNFASFNDR